MKFNNKLKGVKEISSKKTKSGKKKYIDWGVSYHFFKWENGFEVIKKYFS